LADFRPASAFNPAREAVNAPVEFRILGPLEVVEDGEPVALGTLKEQLVLGVLLLHANEFVSRERLIDDLWGEAPPPTARKAVNVYLSKLRKALARGGAGPIVTASGGYRLQIDLDKLDAGRTQLLVASAREFVSNGELESAAERFQEALSLWRGPTLAGLQLESRGRDEVARLDELRLAVLMDRIDCDLALGRHEQALGELGVLVREHPLRERLRAQQMLALYRADRQADALDAYAEARQTLVDDLGIEPSEALQRLQQAILRHDPSLETPEGTALVNGLVATKTAPPPTPVTDAEVGEGRTRTRFRARRWQLVLATLVILSGSAAAAAVLSSSAGSSPHVGPDSLVRVDPRSGKIVSVTPVGAEPQQIAVTARGIWTSNLTENTVTRYDLRTHHPQTLGTPPEPFDVVADAGNAWVSSLRSSRVITRFAAFGTGPSAGWGPLDPSHTPKIHLPPPGAVSLALGSGYLWAVAGPKTTPGTDDRVWLIDPTSNRVVRLLRLGRETTSIAFADGTAWIGAFANERTLLSGAPPWTGASWLFSVKFGATGPRKQSYRLETGDTAGPAVAVGYGKVWVLTCGTCNTGFDNQKLLEFDPKKGRIIKRIALGTRNPNALAVGAGSVWLVDQVHASLMQLDPKTHRIRTIPVGNPKNAAICGIAASRDALWVAVGNSFCEDTGG
jgi:DNA-binding SARP family transcriptional activator/streptogramin lyase